MSFEKNKIMIYDAMMRFMGVGVNSEFKSM